MPILLLLVTAILQFGVMYSQYVTLTDAARTGARELALESTSTNPCDPAVAQTIASTYGDFTLPGSDVIPSFANSTNDYCGSNGSGASCTSSYVYKSTCDSNGKETAGDEGTITIKYPYKLTIFGMHVMNITLTSSASDAIE